MIGLLDGLSVQWRCVLEIVRFGGLGGVFSRHIEHAPPFRHRARAERQNQRSNVLDRGRNGKRDALPLARRCYDIKDKT
jgi:hypothetical protein